MYIRHQYMVKGDPLGYEKGVKDGHNSILWLKYGSK